jgi:hypothetical protein
MWSPSPTGLIFKPKPDRPDFIVIRPVGPQKRIKKKIL